jgi:hypothetical protein
MASTMIMQARKKTTKARNTGRRRYRGRHCDCDAIRVVGRSSQAGCPTPPPVASRSNRVSTSTCADEACFVSAPAAAAGTGFRPGFACGFRSAAASGGAAASSGCSESGLGVKRLSLSASTPAEPGDGPDEIRRLGIGFLFIGAASRVVSGACGMRRACSAGGCPCRWCWTWSS